MTDYVRQVSFTAKDALPTGNPNKVVRGIELDQEFEAIRGAVNTKYDDSNLASQAQAEAGTEHGTDGPLMTPLRVAEYFAANPPANTLPSGAEGNLLVHGASTWEVGVDISYINKKLTFDNQETFAGTVSISNRDVFGGHGLVLEGDNNSCAVLISPDGFLAGNEFGFANGFLSLPKDPTADTHAATKKYVDDAIGGAGGLPPGTEGQMLRNNGGVWEVTSALTVDDSSNSAALNNFAVGGTMIADAEVQGLALLSTTNVRAITPGTAIGSDPIVTWNNTFGVYGNAGFTHDEVVITSGDQTIAGIKTFTSAISANGGVATTYADNTGQNKFIVGIGDAGFLVSTGVQSGDLVLESRNIATGDGLQGGGNLSANRTLSVDSTVARTNVAETFSSTITAFGLNITGTGVGGGILTTGISPDTNGTRNCGGASNKWADVQSVVFTENGTALSSKYLGISSKAADSNLLDGIDSSSFMQLSGTQQISGKKEFNGYLTAGNPAAQPDATSNITVGGTIACAAPPVATGIGASFNFGVLSIVSSDERYKRDVVDGNYGLETVKALRAVEFDWNEKSAQEGKHDAGFIAQELLEVIPEAVPYDEDRDIYGINTTPIISALVKAVQELDAKVNAL